MDTVPINRNYARAERPDRPRIIGPAASGHASPA